MRAAFAAVALAALAALAGLAGCESADTTPIDDNTALARERYPDLARLYAGDQGLYRGCSPNGGVCHNGNEFPNLDSLGSIVDNIGRACNQKRDEPDNMHDMCERAGDRLELGSEAIELGWIAADDPAAPPRRFLVGLRTAPAAAIAPPALAVSRDGGELYALADGVAAVTADPADPSGRTLILDLAQPGGSGDPGAEVSAILAGAGVVADPSRIQLGDPNRNGVYGAELGARLIQPGDPQRSYLMRRLTDSTAGPLMPRANCCSWSVPAVRALWCWIAGLAPDGSNALAPIDYDRCPPSPAVELIYPEPGPGCEASGLCPVMIGGGEGVPTFPSIYAEILVPRCSGNGCHDRDTSGHLDMRSEDVAYEALASRVVPGDPAASRLWQKLDPATCVAPGCARMPLGGAALAEPQLAQIRDWILDGAKRRD